VKFYEMELAKAARVLVEDLLGVKENETVVFTADTESDERVVKAAASAAFAAGAKPMVIWTASPLGVGKAADPMLPIDALSEALKKADVWVEFNNKWLLYSTPFERAVFGNDKIRYMNLVGMNVDMIVRVIGRVDTDLLATFMTKITDMTKKAKKMKITTWTFIVGALALAGIFPLAGFWSKDEILVAALENGYPGLFLVGSVVAFLTAFYMFRLIFVAFFGVGEKKGHVQESPWTMTIPLLILAAFSVAGGFIGAPFVENGFAHWVYSGEPHHPQPNLGVMMSSTLLALAGIFSAWLIYGKKVISAEVLAERFKPIHSLLYNKYYIDEVYQWFFDKIVLNLAEACRWHDRNVVDGVAHGLASSIRMWGAKMRFIQTGSMQNYAMVIFAAAVIIALWLAVPVLGGI